MSTRPRRSYRPNLDGFRLEDRIVLDAASVTAVGSIAAAAAANPPNPVVKAGFLQQTPLLLHAAFQNFINIENRAAQSAVRGLANGQNPDSLLASLKANTSVQGGILQAKVEQISKRIPTGQQNLYNPPQGLIPGSTPPTPGLKSQIDTMLTTLLNNATTLQNALSQNAPLTILQTYQSCKAAMIHFVNNAIANGVFTVGPNQGT
jgi:hypothetical protein